MRASYWMLGMLAHTEGVTVMTAQPPATISVSRHAWAQGPLRVFMARVCLVAWTHDLKLVLVLPKHKDCNAMSK